MAEEHWVRLCGVFCRIVHHGSGRSKPTHIDILFTTNTHIALIRYHCAPIPCARDWTTLGFDDPALGDTTTPVRRNVTPVYRELRGLGVSTRVMSMQGAFLCADENSGKGNPSVLRKALDLIGRPRSREYGIPKQFRTRGRVAEPFDARRSFASG